MRRVDVAHHIRCTNRMRFAIKKLLFLYHSSILLRHRPFVLSVRVLTDCCKGGFILRSIKACLIPPTSRPTLGHMRGEMCLCYSCPSLRQCVCLSMGSWLFSVRMFLSLLSQNNTCQIANGHGSPSWQTNSPATILTNLSHFFLYIRFG